MKLLRAAMIYVTPPPEGWDSWALRIGNVTVQTITLGKAFAVHNAKRLLVKAETALMAPPTIDDEGLIDVPVAERRACEQAIETAGNTIAVLTRSGRRISSAWPPVAFVPESDDDRSHLASAKGIRYRHRAAPGAAAPVVMTDDLLRALADRFDGIASLADFFSTNHALGRYREAVRFLEMAFARPVTQLEKKLSQFLATGRFGYTREEVSSWLLHRHGAVHGDQKTAAEFTWESDVRPFIDRIEQALLDILFNKAEWRSSSQTRRHTWNATFGTPALGGDIFGTQGAGGTVTFQLLDAWGTFPLDLSSMDSPPAEWWCKIAEAPGGATDA